MANEDLGQLPKLKAYRTEGPATFIAGAVFWVEVQDTKNTMTEEGGLSRRFMLWAYENKMYSRNTSSGGGFFSGFFNIAHGKKIHAWLLANGAIDANDE